MGHVMTCDTIQKQIDDIWEQNHSVWQILSIFVLLLQVTLFTVVWFGEFWLVAPYLRKVPILNAERIALDFHLPVLIVSLILLICTVLILWRVKNKPQFHVLYIEREEGGKEIDTKRFLTFFLIPIGISIGLSFCTIYYGIYPVGFWWRWNLWWAFEHTLPPWYPLLSIISVYVLLDVATRRRPERVQRGLPWLLSFPIVLSIIVAFDRIYANAVQWLDLILQHATPLPGSIGFVDNVLYFSYMTLLLTSFIVIFYLIQHQYTNAERGKLRTLVKERRMRGLVEKGVGILPKEVHVNDSYCVPLSLRLSKSFLKRGSLENFRYDSNDYIEAELQGVGLEVDSDKRSKICEDSPLPITTWSCCFIKPGIQTITLTINAVKSSNNSRHVLFVQKHAVKVNSFRNISLAPALAIITPILITVLQAFLKAG